MAPPTPLQSRMTADVVSKQHTGLGGYGVRKVRKVTAAFVEVFRDSRVMVSGCCGAVAHVASWPRNPVFGWCPICNHGTRIVRRSAEGDSLILRMQSADDRSTAWALRAAGFESVSDEESEGRVTVNIGAVTRWRGRRGRITGCDRSETRVERFHLPDADFGSTVRALEVSGFEPVTSLWELLDEQEAREGGS